LHIHIHNYILFGFLFCSLEFVRLSHSLINTVLLCVLLLLG